MPWRLWHRLSRALPVEATGATVGMRVVPAVLGDNPLTRTSSRLTHPPSPHLMSLWRRSTGFACWSRKFRLLGVTDEQKVYFVAQQLLGSAGAWWETFQATELSDHPTTWQEFSTAFREFSLLV